MKARAHSSSCPFIPHVGDGGKSDEEGFRKLVQPLIGNYCMDCHDEETSKGNLSLEGIKGNLVDGPDLDHWEKVLHQLELGQMPPKKKPQPTTAERHSLVQWIRAEFLKGGRKPKTSCFGPGRATT